MKAQYLDLLKDHVGKTSIKKAPQPEVLTEADLGKITSAIRSFSRELTSKDPKVMAKGVLKVVKKLKIPSITPEEGLSKIKSKFGSVGKEIEFGYKFLQSKGVKEKSVALVGAMNAYMRSKKEGTKYEAELSGVAREIVNLLSRVGENVIMALGTATASLIAYSLASGATIVLLGPAALVIAFCFVGLGVFLGVWEHFTGKMPVF